MDSQKKDIVVDTSLQEPEWAILTKTSLGLSLLSLVIYVLERIIAKPKLTSKLLQRPPFKLIYDIVAEVADVTLYGAELITEFSTAPNDKSAK